MVSTHGGVLSGRKARPADATEAPVEQAPITELRGLS